MASIIPGYNYDIFISYRQKDNRGERWVSEFAESLKTELESTFKEEISLYFDINPHDGLLETHDVDASLKEKLRCLIFIPVISRTYCDPKSFAWEHEFKAFIEMASVDQLGLKVKLPNGNVASRVLPVQIHDLDTSDKKLVEDELGGFLRGIEFIYKAPGINRPLLPKEINQYDNLNHTNYRDQINKVGNAVKEIITAIKQDNPQQTEFYKEVNKHAAVPLRNRSKNLIIGATIVLVITILSVLIIPNLLTPGEQSAKSIAVLPFKSLSDEPEKQYQSDGMMEAITLHLMRIKDLQVISRTSVEKYRETLKTTRQIGKELDVEYLVEGSFQKFGDNTKLIVRLIDADKQRNIWGEEYRNKWSEIFSLQSNVAQKIARELGAVITPEEKEIIETVPTKDLNAYDLYQQAWKIYYSNPFPSDLQTIQRIEILLKKALKYDSTFAKAHSFLAGMYILKNWNTQESYFTENYLDSAMIITDKALSYDAQLDEAYYCRALYYNNTGQPEKAILEFNKAIKYNPNYWEAYRRLGSWVYLSSLEHSDYVKGLECLHKAIRLNRSVELIPILEELAYAYTYKAGFPEIGRKYYTEAFNLQHDTLRYLVNIGMLEIQYGDFKNGIEKLLKVNAKVPINRILAQSYFLHGEYNEAMQYYKRLLVMVKQSGSYIFRRQSEIAYTYWQNGNRNEAEYWFSEQLRYSQGAIRLGRYYSTSFDPQNAFYDLAGVYAFRQENEKAYEILRMFDRCKVISFTLLEDLRKYNPLFNAMRDDPEFQKILKSLESKYQAEHERVRKWIEKNEIV